MICASTTMFIDEFGEFKSLADRFRQIGYDERLHKRNRRPGWGLHGSADRG